MKSIFNSLDLVIAQPLSKKIDQAGNQKHIINFLWPNNNQTENKFQPDWACIHMQWKAWRFIAN